MSGASSSQGGSKSAAETSLTSSTSSGITQAAGSITSTSRTRPIQPASAIGRGQVPPTKLTRSHSTTTAKSRGNITVKGIPSSPMSNSSSGMRSTTSRNIPPTSIATSHTRTRSNASSRPRVDDTGRSAGPVRQTLFGKSEAKPAVSAHPRAAPDGAPAIQKPAFNTFNQHFSPKKNVPHQTRTTAIAKPAPGSYPHPPPPSTSSGHSGISSTPTDSLGSTIRIRDELVQLSLVRDKAGSNLRTYKSSVDLHILSARRDVETQLSSLRALERAQQHRLNAFALKEWLRRSTKDMIKMEEGNTALSPASSHAKDKNESGGGVIDQNSNKSNSRLLILAQFTRQMAEIVRPHGELDTLMTDFDRWCQSALPSFQDGSDYGNSEINPVVAHGLIPLDPHWPSSASSVEAKVKACRDSLSSLSTTGDAKDDQSCIVALIKTLSQLSEQVLEEIAMCKVVEALISRCQKDRVDLALADALAEAAQVDMARDGCVSTHHSQPRKGVWEDVWK